MKFYDFKLNDINNKEVSLSEYKDKVILVVNVASKCGYTKQYGDLQKIYSDLKDKNFVILGFPCNQFLNQEYSENDKIKEFCSTKWGVTFPIFSPLKVKGSEQHPLYTWLTEQMLRDGKSKEIKWNFEKFLINKNGEVVGRFGPATTPMEILPNIEKLI